MATTLISSRTNIEMSRAIPSSDFLPRILLRSIIARLSHRLGLTRRPRPRNSTTRGCPVVASRWRSEEHTSELQSQSNLVCRLLLEKKKNHRDGWSTTVAQPCPPHLVP